MPFSASCLRETSRLAGCAGQPAAGDCSAAADRRGLCRSRHHVSRAPGSSVARRAIRGRAERSAAVATGARLERRGCGASTGAVDAASAVAAEADATDRAAEAHNVLGRLLGRAGASSNDVASAFREAIRLRPDYAEAHNNLGLVLIQAGDDQNGIAALREAVRLAPDYAEAHANLGAALTPTDRRGSDPRARESRGAGAELRQGAVQSGDRPTAPARAMDRRKKSSSCGRSSISMPTFARAHLALGKALLRTAKSPKRSTQLQEAARLEPTSGEAHYQLGLALARAGRKEEAAAELQKGRELVAADDRNQNADSRHRRRPRGARSGRARCRRSTKFRHALQLQPDSPDAQQYLGTALEKQGTRTARSPPTGRRSS